MSGPASRPLGRWWIRMPDGRLIVGLRGDDEDSARASAAECLARTGWADPIPPEAVVSCSPIPLGVAPSAYTFGEMPGPPGRILAPTSPPPAPETP